MQAGEVMKHEASRVLSVSETRFSHYGRAAPAAERQRVFVRAMKVATEEQRKIIELNNSKKSGPVLI